MIAHFSEKGVARAGAQVTLRAEVGSWSEREEAERPGWLAWA